MKKIMLPKVKLSSLSPAVTYWVFRNGVLMREGKGNDYTVNKRAVTFSMPLKKGEVVDVRPMICMTTLDPLCTSM